MKKNFIIPMFVILLVITSGVYIFTIDMDNDKSSNVDVSKDDETKDPLASLGNITSFEEAVNVFSFEFYKKIFADKTDENIFFSPYSIFTALAMTYEGANGTTASEMADVLNIEQDNDSFHQYMKNLYLLLNSENENYNISTANALWPNVGFELLDDYTDVIKEFYGGDATEVDYSNAAQAAAIINQWIENQTNNLIKDLIKETDINAMTRLILTNAIYFKGTWQVQFDEENTTERSFLTSNGETVNVDTMKLVDTEDEFNYTETDDLQILELPYTGNDLSMVVLLPKDDVSLSEIVNYIDAEQLSTWLDSMTKNEVDIYLPKFKIETPVYNLNDYLIELGIQDAFNPSNADFSGITGFPNLFISKVLHKAFIEVNEEGTEAAAATAVLMELTSAPGGGGSSRIVVDCDHPFMYLIQHKETGTILFSGNINDPST